MKDEGGRMNERDFILHPSAFILVRDVPSRLTTSLRLAVHPPGVDAALSGVRRVADLRSAAPRPQPLRLVSPARWLPALRIRLRARAGIFPAGHLGAELRADRAGRRD